MPEVGNHFSVEAKIRIIINPSQDPGVASNTYEILHTNWSNLDPFLRAA